MTPAPVQAVEPSGRSDAKRTRDTVTVQLAWHNMPPAAGISTGVVSDTGVVLPHLDLGTGLGLDDAANRHRPCTPHAAGAGARRPEDVGVDLSSSGSEDGWEGEPSVQRRHRSAGTSSSSSSVRRSPRGDTSPRSGRAHDKVRDKGRARDSDRGSGDRRGTGSSKVRAVTSKSSGSSRRRHGSQGDEGEEELEEGEEDEGDDDGSSADDGPRRHKAVHAREPQLSADDFVNLWSAQRVEYVGTC